MNLWDQALKRLSDADKLHVDVHQQNKRAFLEDMLKVTSVLCSTYLCSCWTDDLIVRIPEASNEQSGWARTRCVWLRIWQEHTRLYACLLQHPEA